MILSITRIFLFPSNLWVYLTVNWSVYLLMGFSLNEQKFDSLSFYKTTEKTTLYLTGLWQSVDN